MHTGPVTGRIRDTTTEFTGITGECRFATVVVNGMDHDVQVLGCGNLHLQVDLLSLHHEVARGSPRLQDGSMTANAEVDEALSGMDPHELVGMLEVRAAIRGINVLRASDAALEALRLGAAGERDAIDRQAQCLASTCATARDRRVGNLALPLVHGLWKCNMYKHIFASTHTI